MSLSLLHKEHKKGSRVLVFVSFDLFSLKGNSIWILLKLKCLQDIQVKMSCRQMKLVPESWSRKES